MFSLSLHMQFPFENNPKPRKRHKIHRSMISSLHFISFYFIRFSSDSTCTLRYFFVFSAVFAVDSVAREPRSRDVTSELHKAENARQRKPSSERRVCFQSLVIVSSYCFLFRFLKFSMFFCLPGPRRLPSFIIGGAASDVVVYVHESMRCDCLRLTMHCEQILLSRQQLFCSCSAAASH